MKNQYPACNGSPNVGPHDDAYGLYQSHQAAIHKAYHKYSGYAARLYDSSNQGAYSYGHQAIMGHQVDQSLQSAACYSLQAFRKHVHTQQEEPQPSQ